MIVNSAGKDLVITKLAIRGQDCSWNDKELNQAVLYSVTHDTVSSDMPYVGNFDLTADKPEQNQVTLDGTTYSFKVASNELTLKSGYTMLIYITNPDSITINDVGLTCGIALHTAQGMYYREANVETTGGP